MSDVSYAELARRLADVRSSQLTDDQRTSAIAACQPIASLLLEHCKDEESASAIAIAISNTIAAISLTSAVGLADTLDTAAVAWGMAAGVVCGHIAMPDAAAEVQDYEVVVLPTGQYL